MVSETPARRFAAFVPPPGAARILTLNALVGSIGTGLFLTGSVLYYTRVVGLSNTKVGLGLSIAGVCGMVASIPMGELADRVGPRQVLVALHLWRVVGYSLMAFVHSFWAFLVMVCIVTMADRAGPPINQAMVGTLFTKQERVRTMAFLRAVRNIGLSVGALLAGIALTADTPIAYRLLTLGNAVSFLPMALLVASLRRYQRIPATAGASAADDLPVPADLRPLRDIPFVGLAVSNGLLMLHDSVLFVALPLWIAQETSAPRIMVSVMLVINTVLTAVGQVRWTAMTETLPAAVRAMVVSGLILAGASLAFAAAHYGGPVTASLLLVVGIIALTVGENLHSASSWQVSFDLSPAPARAKYLSVFGLGQAGQDMLGPSLITALALGFGATGWIGLGALFAVTGLTTRALARTVESKRRAQGMVEPDDPTGTRPDPPSAAASATTVPAAPAN
jgi:MFS family permease